MAALDGIESDWRASQDTDGAGYAPVTSSWLSYGSSYIGNIVENLQLDIKGVHLRYEDDVSSSSSVTATGVMIESLSAQTCDQTWSPKFVNRDPLLGQLDAFKLVSLSGLSVYIDTEAEMFGDLSPGHLWSKMSVHSGSSDDNSQYVLSPINATITMKRNCVNKPLNSKKHPRIIANLQMDTVRLGLSDLQFSKTVAAGRSVVMLKKARQYWRWRPVCKVREGVRRWWHYAITCTLDVIHSRRVANSLENVLSCARDNVKYVEAFMAQLDNPTMISEEHKLVKETQDSLRSYDELKVLREIAVYWVERQQVKSVPTTPERKVSTQVTPVLSPSGDDVASPTLQRWFPLWGGWYNSDQAQVDTEQQQPGPVQLEEYLQDAIKEDQEVLGVSHKDVVFSHVSIDLKQLTIQLCRSKSKKESNQLFEFEFQDVKVEHEHRPRTKSYLFSFHVGAIWLRDKITKNSLFPLLVSPQSSESAPLHAKLSQSRFSEFAKSIQTYLPGGYGNSQIKDEEAPIFYFLYENKPFNSKVDHRIHVKSQPINIVYNPIVIKVVTEFFSIPDDINTASHLSDQIKSAALNRINEAKQRTKEEFARNINYILKGNSLERKIWDVILDLSAPKLLIPDHFEDKNSSLIVIDFGKLVLTNKNASKTSLNSMPDYLKVPEDEDDEDLFLTPASTPGAEEEPKFNYPIVAVDEGVKEESCEKLLHSAMYDTFNVDLNNMQIIVGCVKDNWRGAHMKGNSSLHMVDRFSISLNIERRTVETNDPAWPSLLVSGTLPGLRLHFNEDKLVTLKHVLVRLLGPEYGASREMATQTVTEQEDDNGESEDGLAIFGEWDRDNDVDVASKLLVAHFCVSDLSIELQSFGKPIAEVQVSNMKAGITRRPYDTNLSMSVHSLLVVDALQTFGPDYELLVASHKNVCVDTVSGSLKGSDPSSPMSPGSPVPSASPPSQADLSKALSTLDSTNLSIPSPPVQRRIGSPIQLNDILDPAALISIDVMLVSPSCPTLEEDEELKIVNIQFNSLDVIANQETIMELIAFSRRVFPPDQSAYKKQYSKYARFSQCKDIFIYLFLQPINVN